MEKKEIEHEFQKINYELRVNRPDSAPYLPDIVKRREFLLFAQVHLSNILDANLKEDRWSEMFETEMYNKAMEIYFKWGRDE
jgi:hypothetical protein